MPPVLEIKEGHSNVSLVASSASSDSTCQNSPGFKEHNYMGLSDSSTVESAIMSSHSDEKGTSLNLNATELRLGLPGSQSPDRDSDIKLVSPSKLDEKPLFPLAPLQKNVVSGNKRGFSDAMDMYSKLKTPAFTQGNWIYPKPGPEVDANQPVEQGKFSGNSGFRPSANGVVKPALNKDQSGAAAAHIKDMASPKISQEKINSVNNGASAPAAKAQVVGWPPIRSFRKNTLASNSKNNEEIDGKPGSGAALFVKVSMDGAPYLRKVDLTAFSAYNELSSALEKMFSCFTIGQYVTNAVPGRDKMSESKLRDLLHGSEYVLTYEDKDGDWMLVGDVPWEMFIDSCKRLRIMKGTDAIGLAPRAMEKCRNQN